MEDDKRWEGTAEDNMKEAEQFYETFFVGERQYQKSMQIFIAWIMEGIAIFLMMIPVQEFETAVFSLFILHFVGAWFMVRSYCFYAEEGKTKRIFSMLKYTPVDTKLLKRYATQKLLKHLRNVTIVSLVLQLVCCIPFGGELSWLNVVYPIGMMFVVPLCIVLSSIWME